MVRKPGLPPLFGAPWEREEATETLFHGSPNPSLTVASSNPEIRQFDNATSQFGAFFALDVGEAARYADPVRRVGGTIYSARFRLTNPYEMPWREFGYYQNLGSPSSQWAERLAQLRIEAKARRTELEAAGHDGIIVRTPKGIVIEVVSFSDVPITRLGG